MSNKQRVLILCTANSARSQMAEGLLRWVANDKFDVFSAGSQPSTVNPFAIWAMAELGVDISRHRSKSLDEFVTQPFDYVITVCDNAAQNCPHFPGKAQRIHWSFPDPAAAQSDEAKRHAFREVRDGLLLKLREFSAK